MLAELPASRTRCTKRPLLQVTKKAFDHATLGIGNLHAPSFSKIKVTTPRWKPPWQHVPPSPDWVGV